MEIHSPLPRCRGAALERPRHGPCPNLGHGSPIREDDAPFEGLVPEMTLAGRSRPDHHRMAA